MAQRLVPMFARLTSAAMDALAHLLGDVRADGALFGQTIMRPPWSVRFADGAALTVLVPVQGPGWVHPGPARGGAPGHPPASTSATWPSSWAPPRSRSPTRPSCPNGRVTPSTPPGPAAAPTATARSSGPTCAGASAPAPPRAGRPRGADADGADSDDDGAAVVLTGSYHVTGRVSERLLGALPRLVVVHDWGEPCPLMDVTFAEVVRAKPGQQAILDRLLDLLLLTTLREWFDRADAEPPAWYRAMGDPTVGEALRRLHDAPERPWTVAALADEVGVSRATLARRFADLVGEPPMTYLTSWRLSLAADLLERTDLSVDAIARQVGYVSGYSLSVAFKRVLGAPPRRAPPDPPRRLTGLAGVSCYRPAPCRRGGHRRGLLVPERRPATHPRVRAHPADTRLTR